MPIDLVKFYTHFFDPHKFYEQLLQTNLDDYEEKNKYVHVRENHVVFKFIIVVTINEANMHYQKHGLKQIFLLDQKR